MNNRDKNPKVLKLGLLAVRSDIITTVGYSFQVPIGYATIDVGGGTERRVECSEMEALAFVHEWDKWLRE